VTDDPEVLQAIIKSQEGEIDRLRDPRGIGVDRFILEIQCSGLERALLNASKQLLPVTGIGTMGTFRKMLEEVGFARCCDCGMIVPISVTEQVGGPGIISSERICVNCKSK
jgi:hypothetical protein